MSSAALNRIQEIAALRDGWDGADAKAPASLAVLNCLKVIQGVLAENLPVPDIAPRPDGSVVFAWTSDDCDAEALFMSDNTIVYDMIDKTTAEHHRTHDPNVDASRIADWLQPITQAQPWTPHRRKAK